MILKEVCVSGHVSKPAYCVCLYARAESIYCWLALSRGAHVSLWQQPETKIRVGEIRGERRGECEGDGCFGLSIVSFFQPLHSEKKLTAAPG